MSTPAAKAAPKVPGGASAAAKPAGGSAQPAQKYTIRGALNRSSVKFASFLAMVYHGHVQEYTYKGRRDNATVTGYKFQAWLVGTKAEQYLIGFVKGTQAICEDAKKRFVGGSILVLSRVVFA